MGKTGLKNGRNMPRNSTLTNIATTTLDLTIIVSGLLNYLLQSKLTVQTKFRITGQIYEG